MNHQNNNVAQRPPVAHQPELGAGPLPLPPGVLCFRLFNLGDRAAKLVPLLKNDPVVLAVLEPTGKNDLRVLVRAPAASIKQTLNAALHFQRRYDVSVERDINGQKEESR